MSSWGHVIYLISWMPLQFYELLSMRCCALLVKHLLRRLCGQILHKDRIRDFFDPKFNVLTLKKPFFKLTILQKSTILNPSLVIFKFKTFLIQPSNILKLNDKVNDSKLYQYLYWKIIYSFFHSLMMTSAIWGRNITKWKTKYWTTMNIFLTIIEK